MSEAVYFRQGYQLVLDAALGAIGFSSLEYFIEFDDGGAPVLNLKRADGAAIRGLQVIRITGNSGPAENFGAIELRLPDRLSALRTLLEIYGPPKPPKTASQTSLDARLRSAIERCKNSKTENR